MGNEHKKRNQSENPAFRAALRWLIPVGILVVGIGSGIVIEKYWGNDTTNTDELPRVVRESSEGKYAFINPLLLVESPEQIASRELVVLEREIQALTKEHIVSHKADKISVFFRDPQKGSWFAINDDDKYTPASLLKVPTMIAYFKLAESNPDLLHLKIHYDGNSDENSGEYFKSSQRIEKGTSYTVEELIRAMIISSDNNATGLLNKTAEPDALNEVYQDIGIPLPAAGSVDFMTVRSYAYFFRVLYNATYLSREFSEKAMQILSETDFSKGMRAGVPSHIPIAHKFGERTIRYTDAPDVDRELHDCGYVYYPNHPYLLCIMTKGKNFDDLASVIKSISKSAYTWVEKEYN